MTSKEEEFLKRLLITFKSEADEHIAKMTSCLLGLENAITADKIELLYRETHSLKGAARSVGIVDIEAICQVVESVLHSVKRNEIQLTQDILEPINEAVIAISKILSDAEYGKSHNVRTLIQTLVDISKGIIPSYSKHQDPIDFNKKINIVDPPKLTQIKPLTEEKNIALNYIKIDSFKLEEIISKLQEMVLFQLTAAHLSESAFDIGSLTQYTAKSLKEITNTKIDIAKHNNLYYEVIANLNKINVNIMSLHRDLMALHHNIGLKTEVMIDELRQLILTPFSVITSHLTMMVKDIAKQQGKKVNVFITGDEIAIDKRVLNEIKDPLIHLLRNAVDHGIEHPELRQGKPLIGTIKMDIFQYDSRHVLLNITDDGRGIRHSVLKNTAVKKGILSSEEADVMSDEDALNLIFHPGFSTTTEVTEISGRGLGMSIVKDKIEKIGGSIKIYTEVGKMTVVKLLLPISLASYRAVVVRVSDKIFAISTAHIVRVTRISKRNLSTVQGCPCIVLDGRTYTTIHLSNLLSIPKEDATTEHGFFLIISADSKFLAIEVDEIYQEQEMLLIPLGKHLKRVKNISGASLLGNGDIVLSLNVRDLIATAAKSNIQNIVVTKTDKNSLKAKSVLVVDDSITARTLFKNIFENAGYSVVTAVDGIDAFTILKTNYFDIVISDVQMPRMDGFELVRKIRKDSALSSLPVVLVTGLESREDKEKGIEVGANAYIVKSSFEQENLLTVVKRIIGT